MDCFGDPVAVNFKGDSSFKTALGALLTVALKCFILVYAVESMIGLAAFQDPSIVQYVTYEARNSEKRFNLEEMRVDLSIAVFNKLT